MTIITFAELESFGILAFNSIYFKRQIEFRVNVLHCVCVSMISRTGSLYMELCVVI